MVEKSGRTGKKQNKQSSEKYKKYTLQGDTIVKAKNCPRCGPGIFLAVTKDRMYCGKCHYTEFLTQAK